MNGSGLDRRPRSNPVAPNNQHLPPAKSCQNNEPLRRLAQTVHYRVVRPPIQFHSLIPHPCSKMRWLTGILLRRNPDSPAASVRDYCSGVQHSRDIARNTVLATKSIQHNPDLFFASRILLAGRPLNILDNLLRQRRVPGLLYSLHSLVVTTSPKPSLSNHAIWS